VLASAAALAHFEQAEVASIDATFQVCELGLMLTTILVRVRGIALPVAYMLGNSKKEVSYRAFFDMVKSSCRNHLRLLAVITDYEEGLRHAAAGAFNCSSFGDRFHFVKANVNKIRGLGLSDDEMRHFKEDLRQVYEQPTEEEFKSRRATFLDAWDARLPDYRRYFQETWTKQFPPRMWVMHGASMILPSRPAADYLKAGTVSFKGKSQSPPPFQSTRWCTSYSNNRPLPSPRSAPISSHRNRRPTKQSPAMTAHETFSRTTPSRRGHPPPGQHANPRKNARGKVSIPGSGRRTRRRGTLRPLLP
jgi:hypothetical protein